MTEQKDYSSIYETNTSVWGEPMWRLIFGIAIAYQPSPEAQLTTRQWFSLLPFILPCIECREHVKQFLDKSPPQKNVFDSNPSLLAWVYELYKHVQVIREKEIQSLESLLEKWLVKKEKQSIDDTKKISESETKISKTSTEFEKVAKEIEIVKKAKTQVVQKSQQQAQKEKVPFDKQIAQAVMGRNRSVTEKTKSSALSRKTANIPPRIARYLNLSKPSAASRPQKRNSTQKSGHSNRPIYRSVNPNNSSSGCTSCGGGGF